jgi:hypothetical protein
MATIRAIYTETARGNMLTGKVHSHTGGPSYPDGPTLYSQVGFRGDLHHAKG